MAFRLAKRCARGALRPDPAACCTPSQGRASRTRTHRHAGHDSPSSATRPALTREPPPPPYACLPNANRSLRRPLPLAAVDSARTHTAPTPGANVCASPAAGRVARATVAHAWGHTHTHAPKGCGLHTHAHTHTHTRTHAHVHQWCTTGRARAQAHMTAAHPGAACIQPTHTHTHTYGMWHTIQDPHAGTTPTHLHTLA
jgi:hypothetical protein